MDKNQANHRKNLRRKRWGILLLVALVGFLIAFKQDSHTPKNLGNEIVYIGKTSVGCWFLCDSTPKDTYYFGTDMGEKELKEYFRNLDNLSIHLSEQEDNDIGSIYFALNASQSGKHIFLKYFTNGAEASNRLHMNPKGKAHLIEIEEEYYKNLRKTF